MPGQSIRRSQFITTYGPGAILEGPEGPRVIHTLEQSGIFQNVQPGEYEIVERRLSDNVLGGARIVAIPSNAQLGFDESRPAYETSPFPKWSLCVTHSALYRRSPEDLHACPLCPPLANKFAAGKRAAAEKTRFVQICDAGHMQDVDWPGMVSSMGGTCQGSCRPSHFQWRGGGSALRSVTIRCPTCGGSANLGQAYARTWRCSGDFPEERTGGSTPPCSVPSSIVQRGASNVFVPETLTALTIPPAALELHRLLNQSALRVLLSYGRPADFATLRGLLEQVASSGQVPRGTIDTILSYPEGEVMRALDDVLRPVVVQTPAEMRLDEYRRLRDAAADGFPLEPGAGRTQFEVIRTDVRTIPIPSGELLRVTPVSRLRVVMVQTGYSRLGGSPVDRRALINGEPWYPGVELFGEGLFFDLVDNSAAPAPVPVQGAAAAAWSRCVGAAQWADPDHRDPAFVWLHTLSHRLISALSLTCGYSSAALRERIFVEPLPGGARIGGFLLYTVQPGGDGTLGGLVSLVPTFERVVERAFRDLDSCSNDPLCGREHFGPDRVNGAACYACLFQSETSCEHRNALLDRNVLLGT